MQVTQNHIHNIIKAGYAKAKTYTYHFIPSENA